MRMIISSGNGPQECEKAVYEYFKYLKKEFAKYNIEYRYIESEAGNKPKTFRSVVLQIKENGGFSYANNQGYQYAREHFGKSYIIVLNNDIEFTQKDFISRLEKSYVNNQCYVLGPDVTRQSTGEHQNPMDTRLRTKEEAEYTIKMKRIKDWPKRF